MDIGIEGQIAAKPAIDVFDTAFLPWTVWVAEEGLERERSVEFVVVSELDTIVLGECSAEFMRHALEPEGKICRNAVCSSILLFDDMDKTGGAFLGDEDV